MSKSFNHEGDGRYIRRQSFQLVCSAYVRETAVGKVKVRDGFKAHLRKA